ncbi:MAG: M15 family metallopeptidase [Candidatus Sumerlaeaceae bacterium]
MELRPWLFNFRPFIEALKYLLLLFTLCVLTLSIQVYWSEPPPNPYSDGHLVCLPMPPSVPAPEPVLLPPPVIIASTLPRAPLQSAGAPLEIYSPAAGSERMVETRAADQTDWGILRGGTDSQGLVLASMGPIRVVKPIPVPPPVEFDALDPEVLEALIYGEQLTSSTETMVADEPASAPAEQAIAASVLTVNPPRALTPNLYLPEGAINEAGAQLTLIKAELRLHEQPDAHSATSQFTLREGERVRPLTRLRSERDFDWIKIEWEGRAWWAEAEYFIRVDPRNHLTAQIRSLPIGEEAVDRDSALPIDYAPDDLVPVARQYTLDTREHRLRREVVEALVRMADEAARQNLKLKVFSGYRDFEHQKKLYLEAIEKNGPKQNGVAAPGYSEHQLGTTIDVSSPDRRTVLSKRFGESQEGRWLHDNAERFGFRNSYTNENTEQVGYKPEPWHLRYVGSRSGDRSLARH